MKYVICIFCKHDYFIDSLYFWQVEIFDPSYRIMDIFRLQCDLKDIYFPYIQVIPQKCKNFLACLKGIWSIHILLKLLMIELLMN